ncbi:MAG: methylated-DNA-protein-cysteine methyltransferase-like protein [Salibacteraceae bacterium]|jgi:methylated-DNA-protein-cysteine methyltransferase-like protein
MTVIKLSEKNKNFFDRVYQVARLIPYGRATNYGAIGKYLGSARSARMVGWAMNGCSKSDSDIPAHRVVNRLGVLSGKNHFETPTLMQEKLEAEGIEVKDDQIVNFKEVFWDPEEELTID